MYIGAALVGIVFKNAAERSKAGRKVMGGISGCWRGNKEAGCGSVKVWIWSNMRALLLG